MIGTRPGQKASAKGLEKPRIRQKIVGADKKTRVNECAFIKGGKNTFVSIVGIQPGSGRVRKGLKGLPPPAC